MSTSNFACKDKLFAVSTDDELDYDFLQDNIMEHLTNLDHTAKVIAPHITMDIYAFDKARPSTANTSIERNYPSVAIGEIIVKTQFMSVDLTLMLQVLIRGGYYDHVNIDYTWVLDVDGNEFEAEFDGEDIFDHIDIDYLSAGIIAMNKKHLNKRLNDMRKVAQEVFINTGETFGEQIHISAQFSNGETHYEKDTSQDKTPFFLLKIAA